jgi:hypothetical protein
LFLFIIKFNKPLIYVKFNADKNFLKYIDKGWDLLKPKEIYNESLTDNNPYEGKLFKKTPFFPYNLKYQASTLA